MEARSRHPRVSRAAAAALGCLLVLSCGSTTKTTTTGLAATFTSNAPSPADDSVTLQPGTATGTLFQVRASVKGVTDFFGAAFWISYDTTNVYYSSYDITTTFMCQNMPPEITGCDPTSPSPVGLVVIVDALSVPGTIKVAFSRERSVEGKLIPGVDVTSPQDLIVFNFIARQAVTHTPIVFVDGHEEVINSSPPPTNTINVTWAGGTLTAK